MDCYTLLMRELAAGGTWRWLGWTTELLTTLDTELATVDRLMVFSCHFKYEVIVGSNIYLLSLSKIPKSFTNEVFSEPNSSFGFIRHNCRTLDLYQSCCVTKMYTNRAKLLEIRSSETE